MAMTRIRRDPPPTPSQMEQHSCFNCQMRNRTEWCVLPQVALSQLDDSKRVNTFSSGHVIYHQGDPVRGIYCIESGTVAIRKTDVHGNSILLRLAHAGQTIGYRDFFGGEVFAASAETLTPTTLCHVDRDSLRNLLSHNPELGLKFLSHIAKDLDTAEDAILQHTSLSVRTRLAHLLLTLKDRYAGVNARGEIVISLPINRQDIAALLGTRPETIARTIHALESDSVVSFSGRQVLVPDLSTLLNEIESN
ncbi:MAG: Crp/Fnr family transcriptional regulator [Deltaproteobacteria bacterium]|nr:Crp/Fnr family transcriptional regulator [Deltaproteobacteria bacterium]